jgi:hypothetical protein
MDLGSLHPSRLNDQINVYMVVSQPWGWVGARAKLMVNNRWARVRATCRRYMGARPG